MSPCALQASLPGRQGYLEREKESQSHFPQPHCLIWISGTRISIDLEKDHIPVREGSTWAEMQVVVGGETPRHAYEYTQSVCTHNVCWLSKNQRPQKHTFPDKHWNGRMSELEGL